MIFRESSIICAVKNDEMLSVALDSQCDVLFLLKADINTIFDTVDLCKSKRKKVFIHVDLFEGFGKDLSSIKFLSSKVKPDGILSTKSNLIKYAKDCGMSAILRVFMIDSQSMESAITNLEKLCPDAVEIMPGVAYDAIRELRNNTKNQIIAGGFIKTYENAVNAFKAGASACSTSNPLLWAKK